MNTLLNLEEDSVLGSIGWITSLCKLDLELRVTGESLKSKKRQILLKSSVASWKEGKFWSQADLNFNFV